MVGTSALRLAPVSLGNDRNTAGFYGADVIAAKYCGLSGKLPSVAAVWMHGWVRDSRVIHPAIILGAYNSPDPAGRYFVATGRQLEFLRRWGFTDVHAIGLPLVYLSSSKAQREPGSLLVMPPHSVPYTHHKWDEEEYAEEIDSVRGEFSRVAVCIHPFCWSRGYWVEAFRRRGYELIRGIGAQPGAVPLEWMRDLLSSFEFVTTNDFGSQLAYGAYFGCKVSVFGPKPVSSPEDYSDDPLIATHRRVFEEAELKVPFEEEFPFLFCDPRKATSLKVWADDEVGEVNRRSPAELKELIGWSGSDRLSFAVSRVRSGALGVAKRWIPEPAKQWWRQRPNHPDGEVAREEARLRSLPPLTRGVSTLLGPEIEFVDPHSFLRDVREVFQRQMYRFASDFETPVVIDCGANIGLTVLYMKALYPKARITAFEPDPQVFEVLEANVRRLKLEDIELRQEAVWNKTGVAPFRVHGGDAGRLAVRPGEPNTIEVKTTRLRDLLTGPIDFLKIDVEGAETDILEDCDGALGDAKRVFVEYHSYIERPQQLDKTLKILRDAGLRLHLDAHEASPNPILIRKIHNTGIDSLDMIMNIWAYRR